MAILNPVVSKFVLTAGIPQEVYSCPLSKSHAIVDLSFFKDDLSADTMLEVALTTKSNPALLDSVDYFIDDIELIGTVNSAELSKIIVGSGERLYIRVITGPNIIARLSGVEENNPMVIKAGRLAALSVPGTTQTTIFENTQPGTAYTTCSITIYNASPSELSEVEAWITSAGVPTDTDKALRITIPNEDTTIVENILLAPNEKLVFKASQPNCEYFVNGVIIGASS